MTQSIGRTHWAIAEGYIPPDDQNKPHPFVSHEACCLLNAGDAPAHIEIMIYFADREPVGPYSFTVEPRRTLHLRYNEFREPEPVPAGTNFASTIISDVPIVVQHTRLDSRSGPVSLMTTMAFAA